MSTTSALEKYFSGFRLNVIGNEQTFESSFAGPRGPELSDRLHHEPAGEPVRRRASTPGRPADLHDARREDADGGDARDPRHDRPKGRHGRLARLDRPEARPDPRPCARPAGEDP